MFALAIWKWWFAHVLRSPRAWLVILAAAALPAVASRLGPLQGPWTIADDFAALGMLVGVSAAVTFLGHGAPVLEHVAGRARWGGEAAIAITSAASLPLALVFGAALEQSPSGEDLGHALAVAVGVSTFGAAAAVGVLRVQGPSSIRVSLLWSALWILPALVGHTRWTCCVEPRSWVGSVARPTQAPLEALSATLVLAALLILGATVRQPRADHGPR